MLAACLALAGCGGGGGGVKSTPTPPRSPPPASGNTLITDLHVDQTFAGEATTTHAGISLPDGITQSTEQERQDITVRYDASSKTYTIETPGRSQSFAPSDMLASRFDGETQYAKAGEHLTLVTTPYYGYGVSNRYVGMGYWQTSSQNGGVQLMDFTTFTYGLGTPDTAVPRTGSAHWTTDIFGLLTAPGVELRTIQGNGDFDVDFASGVFSTSAYVDEFDLVTGGGVVGALLFQAGGSLGSGNSFSGNFSYEGSTDVLGGELAGSFYGPGAEEIGATFNAEGGGAALTGALTGQRSTSDGTALTLLDVPASQRLVANTELVYSQERTDDVGNDIGAVDGGGFVTINPDGTTALDNYQRLYTPSPSELVADGPRNFTTYETTIDGDPARLSYYKVGSSNTELALTYASFASWSTVREDQAPSGARITNRETRYFLYGLETPRNQLAARTGTGTYRGVAYGEGGSLAGASYEVTGTSRFDVDFGAARYSGSLTLAGRGGDGSTTDFGTFAFANDMGYGEMKAASFDGGANADPFHTIQPHFYGPDGEEIGATFHLATGVEGDPNTVIIGGVALAGRQ